VLAGAEEGVRKSIYRVVKINKEETNHYFSRTTVDNRRVVEF